MTPGAEAGARDPAAGEPGLAQRLAHAPPALPAPRRARLPRGWLVATLAAALAALLAAPWAAALPALAWLARPLVWLLIALHAARRGGAMPMPRRWLLVALVAAAAGDGALLLEADARPLALPAALAAFGVALLAALRALLHERRLTAWPLAFVGYVAVVASVLAWLWSGVPAALRLPLALVALALAALAALSAVLLRTARHTPRAPYAALAALGGGLLALAGALAAVHAWGAPLRWPELWLLPPCWLGAWCLASWLTPAPQAAATV